MQAPRVVPEQQAGWAGSAARLQGQSQAWLIANTSGTEEDEPAVPSSSSSSSTNSTRSSGRPSQSVCAESAAWPSGLNQAGELTWNSSYPYEAIHLNANVPAW